MKCETHDLEMQPRAATQQTPEQAWCGRWFDCPAPRCHCVALVPSEALRKQMEQMRSCRQTTEEHTHEPQS